MHSGYIFLSIILDKITVAIISVDIIIETIEAGPKNIANEYARDVADFEID